MGNPYDFSNWGQSSYSMDNLNNQSNLFMGVDPNAANPLAFTGTSPTSNLADLFAKPGTGIPNITALGGGYVNTGSGGFFDNFLDKDGQAGFGKTALGAYGALASTFMGMKQYGLAKDTLENNKKQFQMQYDAQKTMTNSNLEDRQRARVASNAGAYQSVGDYMNKNGIK